MAVKKTGLGRGLDALLGPQEATVTMNRDAAASARRGPSAGQGGLPEIAVDLMRRGRYQPRESMDPDALEDLAASIRVHGVLQPIVVRPLDTEPGYFEILAGERRWRAAQLAQLQEVPVIIREDVPDAAAIAVALIENIQRENLNPLEEARAIRRLIDEFGLTHQGAAEQIGRSRAAVSNLLRLLDLGTEAAGLLISGELEMGHARALLAIPEATAQAEAARQVARRGLSVRDTERLVKRVLAGEAKGRKRPASIDPDVRRLQDELSEKLGARVSIRHNPQGGGKLEVTYNSLDELDGILAHIK